jgi:hypothetical protein
MGEYSRYLGRSTWPAMQATPRSIFDAKSPSSFMKSLLIAILSLLVIPLASKAETTPTPTPRIPLTSFDNLREGDLVFITSATYRADAIKQVTNSQLTHCGIIFKEGTDLVVFEGAGRPAGKHRKIEDWQWEESTKDGEKRPTSPNPIYAKRLKGADAANKIEDLRKWARVLHDCPYDAGFAWHNTDGPDDLHGREFIYCSEFIWKAFVKAGIPELTPLKKIKDYYTNLSGAIDENKKATVVKFLNEDERSTKKRRGKPYDPEESAVSPEDIYASKQLQDVPNG